MRAPWAWRGRTDGWLAAVVVVCAALYLCELGWGLPAQGHSWAVDAVEPLTVLGVIKREFERWNSGWFYFKYPPGYPFLLGAAFAPYLIWLYANGAWAGPAAGDPAGFADPAGAMFVLSIIGRCVSVGAAVGMAWALYLIGTRLFGRWAGRTAAALGGTLYPVVYYAHTTNVDAVYVAALMAAVASAVVAAGTERMGAWVSLGATAAFAVSTREQGFGLLLPLPVLVVAVQLRRGAGLGRLLRPVAGMSAAAVAVAVLANNVWFNPSGFVARMAYLLGHPFRDPGAPLKPVEFAWFKGPRELTYLRQLGDALISGLGWPLTVSACAALPWTVRKRRGVGLWLLLPMGAYYYLGLRGQVLITLRYALPVLLAACVVVAGGISEAAQRARGWRRWAVVGTAGALVAVNLVRAGELDWILATDSRYQAEQWMRRNRGSVRTVEVYQKATYLPRFPVQWRVTMVPLGERTIRAFQQRRPDIVVLSSASRQSIFRRWNEDWRATGRLLVEAPAAAAFLRALERGKLGYERAAVFEQHPRFIRVRITSLAPRITIYRRRARTSRPSG